MTSGWTNKSELERAELLARTMAGEATDEEYAMVRAWATSTSRRVDAAEALAAMWQRPPLDEAVARVDGWRGIVARIETLPKGRRPTLRPTVRVGPRTLRGWTLGISALVAVVLAVFVTRVTVWPRGTSSVRRTERTIATTTGQRATFTLADGSQVTLAPQSRLTLAGGFGADTRHVTLTGEAYFMIRRSTGVPFVVQTGPVSTRVLGTTFDVRHYPDDRTTQVAVFQGRVATGGRTTPVILAAGSMGQVTDSSIVVSMAQDSESFVAWQQGRLVFRDTPVPVMLATLGRWYGYEFHLMDTTLATYHVSVVLRADQSAEAMNRVKAILGVTMTFDGHVVTLQPVHHPRAASPRDPRHDVLSNPELEVGK